MKKVKITMIVTMSDLHYESQKMVQLRQELKGGVLADEILKTSKGEIISFESSYEELPIN